MADLEKYKCIQRICKQVLHDMQFRIKSGMSELEIQHACKDLIKSHGVREFWYHNVPVIVAVGEHSSMSMSGKNYVATNKTVCKGDFLTIDLSLAMDVHWGIYARSFEVGSDSAKFSNFSSAELQKLESISCALHEYLMLTAHPEMTFNELYHLINRRIVDYGVHHLDFRNNFGHSIEMHLDDHVYIEDNCHEKLGSKPLFGFEPHLKFSHSSWGFKDADIYYFKSGKVCRLSQ